jgi:hypothetical protein
VNLVPQRLQVPELVLECKGLVQAGVLAVTLVAAAEAFLVSTACVSQAMRDQASTWDVFSCGRVYVGVSCLLSYVSPAV